MNHDRAKFLTLLENYCRLSLVPSRCQLSLNLTVWCWTTV